MAQTKKIRPFIAAGSMAIGAFGMLSQSAHADTNVLNLTASNGVWTAYIDDKPGDSFLQGSVVNTGNIGVASLAISVVGSGGVSIKSSEGIAPVPGNGSDGVDIIGGFFDPTLSFGISSGSYTSESGAIITYTQTSLGVALATGTYTGNGTIKVFGDDGGNAPTGAHENDSFSIQDYPAGGGLPYPFVTAIPDTVTVIPEPATLGLLAIGALAADRAFSRRSRLRRNPKHPLPKSPDPADRQQ